MATLFQSPGCCGIGVIYDFGQSRNARRVDDRKTIEDSVKAYERDYSRSYAMFQINLNDEQISAGIGDIVKDLGYTPTIRAWHPGHASMIYTFFKVNHPNNNEIHISPTPRNLGLEFPYTDAEYRARLKVFGLEIKAKADALFETAS